MESPGTQEFSITPETSVASEATEVLEPTVPETPEILETPESPEIPVAPVKEEKKKKKTPKTPKEKKKGGKIWRWILIILLVLLVAAAGTGFYLHSTGKLGEVLEQTGLNTLLEKVGINYSNESSKSEKTEDDEDADEDEDDGDEEENDGDEEETDGDNSESKDDDDDDLIDENNLNDGNDTPADDKVEPTKFTNEQKPSEPSKASEPSRSQISQPTSTYVTVTSNIPKAMVTVDGVDVGWAPWSGTLSAGRHIFSLKAKNKAKLKTPDFSVNVSGNNQTIPINVPDPSVFK